jgi:hypothetical protein
MSTASQAVRLLGRQELDRGDERKLHGLAHDKVFEQPVRIGLQMLEVLAQLGGSRPPARDRGEADVRGDGVQPGGELRAWFVAV